MTGSENTHYWKVSAADGSEVTWEPDGPATVVEFTWPEVEGAVGYDLHIGEQRVTPEPKTLLEKVKHRFATKRVVPEWYKVYRGHKDKKGINVFQTGSRVETKRWWERWSE